MSAREELLEAFRQFESRDKLRGGGDNFDYVGGPTALMSALDAQLKREQLMAVEPRAEFRKPCPDCRYWQTCCAVAVILAVVLAVAWMWRS